MEGRAWKVPECKGILNIVRKPGVVAHKEWSTQEHWHKFEASLSYTMSSQVSLDYGVRSF